MVAALQKLAPLFSSKRADWCTPEVVLERVRRVAPIGLDPCSNRHSIVNADHTIRPPRDGLKATWTGKGLIYVNAPWSARKPVQLITPWLAKCHAAWLLSAEAIALVPARVDTIWWHDYCEPPHCAARCIWKGRVTFLGATHPAPIPVALIYWGPRPGRFARACDGAGSVWWNQTVAGDSQPTPLYRQTSVIVPIRTSTHRLAASPAHIQLAEVSRAWTGFAKVPSAPRLRFLLTRVAPDHLESDDLVRAFAHVRLAVEARLHQGGVQYQDLSFEYAQTKNFLVEEVRLSVVPHELTAQGAAP
jgi:site-specific DNA-methyltransferase (adenine-specific)